MRPIQIREALNVAVAKQRPVFVWGPPGVGKSDLIAQVAAAGDMQLVDVRLNLLDPTDVKGFPVPDVAAGNMQWLPANFFPPMFVEQEVEIKPAKGKTAAVTELQTVPNPSRGILFLDELNQAPSTVQAAAYQLLLTRQVGDYKLPDGWAILAAGNRETDRANAIKMPSALALRLIHLDYDVNADDWCEWALGQGDAVPTELLAFIRFRPDLLHAFDPAQRSSPNPRGWVFCGELINSDLSAEVEFEMLKGTVGEAAAGEFKAFLQVFRDLPSIDQIKLDPDGTPLPETAAVFFAITAALASASTKDVFPRFMKYVGRMDPEWQVVYVRDAQKRTNRAITETKEYMQFAIKHSSLLS